MSEELVDEMLDGYDLYGKFKETHKVKGSGHITN